MKKVRWVGGALLLSEVIANVLGETIPHVFILLIAAGCSLTHTLPAVMVVSTVATLDLSLISAWAATDMQGPAWWRVVFIVRLATSVFLVGMVWVVRLIRGRFNLEADVIIDL